MSSSEMGHRYESIPEYIGLCTDCTIKAGIKTWTSVNKEDKNKERNEWYERIKDDLNFTIGDECDDVESEI